MTLYLPEVTYVAVPKNATIATERAFEDHATAVHPHKHDNVAVVKEVSSKPCVASIREPLSWIKSYYLYLRYSPYFYDSHFGVRSDFDTFVRKIVRGDILWPEPHRLQSDYLVKGEHTVESIYRYDDLDKLWKHLSDLCGESITPGRHNVSRRKDVSLSPKVRSLYEDYASADYEIYEAIVKST